MRRTLAQVKHWVLFCVYSEQVRALNA